MNIKFRQIILNVLAQKSKKRNPQIGEKNENKTPEELHKQGGRLLYQAKADLCVPKATKEKNRGSYSRERAFP